MSGCSTSAGAFPKPRHELRVFGARQTPVPRTGAPATRDDGAGKVCHCFAAAANDLNDWREKWLNPDGWLTWEITPEEQAAGFPPRPVPRPEHAAEWKKRTLTNLYNAMPSGLKLRQEHLDNTVAAAYGWDDYTPDMPDATLLKRLLSLNLERARH